MDAKDDNSATIPNHRHNKEAKCLGRWFLDKKRRKFAYLSLSGKKCFGAEAMTASRADKYRNSNPHLSLRPTLHRLMKSISTESLLAFKRNVITSQVTEAVVRSNDIPLSQSQHLGDKYSLEYWGVPVKTAMRYAEEKGLKSLFDWQIECLTCEEGFALNGGNLVYSAPTSGGKTLVSELLMLRRLGIEQHKTIFFVCPFVALVEEKTEYFRNMWRDLQLSVCSFHGDDGGAELTDDTDIAVCTIERANSLLNQLLESGTLASRLSMVVVDEVHMLADSHRGFLLEILLSKILFACKDTVQCVCMSATLPNIEDLSEWLGAALFVSDFRPVSLSVLLACRRRLYTLDTSTAVTTAAVTRSDSAMQQPQPQPQQQIQHQLQFVREIGAVGANTTPTPGPYFAAASSCAATRTNIMSDPALLDEDGLLGLCLETVRSGKCVLIFCSSKDQCQKTAQRWSNFYSQMQQLQANGVTIPSQWSAPAVPTNELLSARRSILRQLSQSSVGLCSLLRQTIPCGAAHHHAGLTSEERKIVEQGFREGSIQILCATSTLAAGVNLPANRVIIRSIYMGMHKGKRRILSSSSFRQMCGRAGRMGYDTAGEAILMVNYKDATELRNAKELICAKAEALQSALHVGVGGGIERLLLELISTGQLQHEDKLLDFVESTLLYWQYSSSVGIMIESSSASTSNSSSSSSSNSSSSSSSSSSSEATGIACAAASSLSVSVSVSTEIAAPSARAPSASAALTSLNVDELVQKAILFLRTNQFVSPTTDSSLRISQLGMATSRSGLSPADAIAVLEPLQQARKCLILKGNGFHCVYLVTPISSSINIVPWTDLESIVHALLTDYPDLQSVLTYLGAKQAELVMYSMNPPAMGIDTDRTRFYRRLYNAIILFLLIQEQPLTKLSTFLKVERGAMQLLQKDASMFCQSVCSFVNELHWDLLSASLQVYTGRFMYGVSDELIGLSKISTDITNIRARALYKADITCAKDIIEAGEKKLTQILVSCVPYYRKDAIQASATAAVSSAVSSAIDSDSTHSDLYRQCNKIAKNILMRAQVCVDDELRF